MTNYDLTSIGAVSASAKLAHIRANQELEQSSYNDTLDTLVISGQNRSVIRHPARDELAPQIPEPQQEKKQRKEVER